MLFSFLSKTHAPALLLPQQIWLGSLTRPICIITFYYIKATKNSSSGASILIPLSWLEH